MISRFLAGSGSVEPTDDGWRLRLGPSSSYGDAQLDDTQGLARRALLHRPPLRLTLDARASAASPGGTLGFGFWNDPFPAWAGEAGAGRILPASPQALWFFHASPPSELPFSRGGPATGWTASSFLGPALPGAVLAALGALGIAGMTLAPLRARLLGLFWQWFSGQQSAPIDGLDRWRVYEIDWSEARAVFRVDDRIVLESRRPPAGPLGLVIWIDNQWAALSEETGIRFGVLRSAPEAWLEIRRLHLNGRPLRASLEPPPPTDG